MQKRPVGIKGERRPHNPTWHAEVENNIVGLPLQIDEFAGRLFNEPLTPVRSDSVRTVPFFSATAITLQGSIISITINNEKVARAIRIKPIDCDGQQINGSFLTYTHY
ncbi:hypothetical protein [Bradyrhizobium sp. JYMT SZCCT0428]|uniref:hypothetical protein n=1 Tax=Bradyrhizobium sp. JYMT SZCCT0428 TaxID=2807673 RepID=UPI001BAB3ADD|nr:hypothetical protein [Bradyrhizobium sp. JYMT SZCCT0428]MBR1154284.1 hypothetical protein [Bradyrhizobium sp. JYMT SZCCT0428]